MFEDDVVFAPGALQGTPPQQQNVQRVQLNVALLFFEATYWHPVEEKQVPLPPHRWAMSVLGGKTSIKGPPSQRGVASIPADPSHANPTSEWMFAWTPLMPDGSDASGDPAVRDVWIDLEKNEWLRSRDVGPMPKRRLLRLCAWRSDEKAHAGGFLLPSGSPRFDDTGRLPAAEVLAFRQRHGHPARAYPVHVDHNWFRAFIRFRYYDVGRKRTASVPPGLLVRALDAAGNTVGAGVSMRDDGTLYVLQTRTKERSADVDYTFKLPGPTPIVDLQAAAPDAVKVVEKARGTRAERYVLPVEWHTLGTDVALAGARVPWTPLSPDPVPTLRTEPSSLDVPFIFDLDDISLTDAHRHPIQLPDPSRVTIFDHLLKIRDPDEFYGHLWWRRVRRNHFAAADATYVEGEGARRFTRLLDYDGNLYDVREDRVLGRAGVTPCLGHRAAVQDDHPHVDYPTGYPQLEGGFFEHHLIDTEVTDFEYGGRTTSLLHLAVYVSSFISFADPDALAPADLHATRQQLDVAAARWDQAHPGRSPSGPAKCYAIVPETLGDGDPVVVLRHIFTERTREAHRKLHIRLHVHITSPPFRAHLNGTTAMMHLERQDLAPPPNHPERDSDGVAAAPSTLAHEMGHVMGLPDEYEEFLETEPAKDGKPPVIVRVPAFDQAFIQGSRCRPFFTDAHAMMESSRHPRLRYLWHHVHALNHNSTFAALVRGKRMTAEMRGFHHTYPRLTYRLPSLPPRLLHDEENRSPWTEVAERPLPSRRGSTHLFRVGADEGAVAGLFQGTPLEGLDLVPAPFHPPVQGLLVVRTNYLFIFNSRYRRIQRNALREFALLYHSFINNAQTWRYVIEAAGPGAILERVGIIFQPYFAMHTAPLSPDITIAMQPDESSEINPLFLPSTLRSTVLKLRHEDLTEAVVRHSLDLPTTQPSPFGPRLITALSPTELVFLGDIVTVMLGDGCPRNVVEV